MCETDNGRITFRSAGNYFLSAENPKIANQKFSSATLSPYLGKPETFQIRDLEDEFGRNRDKANIASIYDSILTATYQEQDNDVYNWKQIDPIKAEFLAERMALTIVHLDN